MANFEKRTWVQGDLDFGATELNRIEGGIEEAINLASSKLPADYVECSATNIKDTVAYINELVKALKG